MNCVIETVVCNSHDMSFFILQALESRLLRGKLISLFICYFLGCPKRPVSSEEWLFSLTHKVINSSFYLFLMVDGKQYKNTRNFFCSV